MPSSPGSHGGWGGRKRHVTRASYPAWHASHCSPVFPELEPSADGLLSGLSRYFSEWYFSGRHFSWRFFSLTLSSARLFLPRFSPRLSARPSCAARLARPPYARWLFSPRFCAWSSRQRDVPLSSRPPYARFSLAPLCAWLSWPRLCVPSSWPPSCARWFSQRLSGRLSSPRFSAPALSPPPRVYVRVSWPPAYAQGFFWWFSGSPRASPKPERVVFFLLSHHHHSRLRTPCCRCQRQKTTMVRLKRTVSHQNNSGHETTRSWSWPWPFPSETAPRATLSRPDLVSLRGSYKTPERSCQSPLRDSVTRVDSTALCYVCRHLARRCQ